jgi:serine/threonine protein kinase/tetratricopeptide (TPR) repeat protein
MPIDFQRVQAIFQAVAELPPAERTAVLDRECDDDAELRRRVEALLRAHDDSRELPAAEPGPQPRLTAAYVPAVEPGHLFAGRYKLREKLGEGGMGVVFVAEQIEPVQRRVALKIIRAGLDTHRMLARFEQERQALALMDHPNIAKVFDAGIDQAGRPYFAMELVKGLPLTRYCDDAKLAPRQRLELFIPVCQAVQHAHQKGIIHRDLKPSNILVGLYDGRPVPKVIDFGVAKATGPRLTEQSVYTEVGSIIGTLEYMSPEQAELNNLDIDTRSDIYALGVILYELLTGAVPFRRRELERAGLAEMLRVIKEVEPPRPSTRLSHSDTLPSIAANRHMEPHRLTALVRGELDWIVMKALEKDRGRRYETANGFATDVQRYLAGEPVLAAPASAMYRLRKFVRRNRGPVVAAGLVLLTLVGGTSGTTLGLVQAKRQRQFADAKTQEAVNERNARDRALKAEQKARADETKARNQAFAALRSMTAEVVERKFAAGTVLTEDDRAFLRGVIAQFDAFAAIKGDDADSRLVRAEGRWRVGLMRYRLGELKEAEQDYNHALSIYKQLAAEFPARLEFRRELAGSHVNRGILLRDTGRLKEAEQDYDEALSICTQLAAEFPAQAEVRERLASSHLNRANLLSDTGRLKVAEQDYERALSIRKQLAADFPARPEFRNELANSHNNRGNLLKRSGRLNEAEQEYDKALSICKQLAAEFPARLAFRDRLAKSHLNRGMLLRDTGRLKEAEQDFDDALSIRKQLAAEFPSRPEFRRELARSHNNRGMLLSGADRRKEAEQDYDRALSIRKQLAAEFPSRPEFRMELARSHNNRGMLLRDTGRLKQAEQEYDQALNLQKQLAADFPTQPEFRQELAQNYNNRGNLLSSTGRLSEAEQDYDQALNIYKQLAAEFPARPEFRQELALSHNNRGFLLSNNGRLKEAERDYGEALTVRKQLAAEFPARPEFRQELAASHNSRGILLSKKGQLEEAKQDYDEALSIGKQLAAEFPNKSDLRNELAGTCVNLALLHQRRGACATAKPLLLEGQPHHLAALKANPRNPKYRQFYRNHLIVLSGVHAELLDQAAAVRTAETCRDLGWDAPTDAYNAACLLSQCIPIVDQHDRLDQKQRQEAVRFYGDAAMQLLRDAVSKGFKNALHMKNDADLYLLRQREDFQQLIADLEGKAK